MDRGDDVHFTEDAHGRPPRLRSTSRCNTTYSSCSQCSLVIATCSAFVLKGIACNRRRTCLTEDFTEIRSSSSADRAPLEGGRPRNRKVGLVTCNPSWVKRNRCTTTEQQKKNTNSIRSPLAKGVFLTDGGKVSRCKVGVHLELLMPSIALCHKKHTSNINRSIRSALSVLLNAATDSIWNGPRFGLILCGRELVISPLFRLEETCLSSESS